MARNRRSRGNPREPKPVTSVRASVFRWPLLAFAALGVLGVAAGALMFVVANREPDLPAPENPAFIASVDQLRQPIHEHVDFALYLRGELFSFNVESLLATEDYEPGPNAHIHAPRTNVIHAHREQTTWSEVFITHGFTLSDECVGTPAGEIFCNSGGTERAETLKFIVNGVEVDSILRLNLSDLDRVLVSFGPAEDANVADQIASLTDEACIPSESCRDREDPANPEKEPCRKSETVCVG